MAAPLQDSSLGIYFCPTLYITSLGPECPDERLEVEGGGCLGGGEAVDGVAEVDEVEEADGGLQVPLRVRLLLVAPRVAWVNQLPILTYRN